MSRSLLCLLALTCAAVSCVGTQKYRAPRTIPEQGVKFTEITRNNSQRDLSAFTNGKVTKIASPAALDVDSSLQIDLLRRKLAGDGADSTDLNAVSAGELGARRAQVVGIVDTYASFLAARLAAVKAWQLRPVGSGGAEFDAAKQAFGEAGGELFDALVEAWPGLLEDQSLISLFESRDLAGIPALVVAEVGKLDAQLSQIEDAVERSRFELRIEAFLARPGVDELTAVHVEGYDDLNQLQVKRFDRSGLDLTPQEWQTLTLAIEAGEDLARALERVKKGEVELDTALREARSELVQRAAARVAELDRLVRALELDARAARVQAAVDRFMAGVTSAAGELSESSIEAARKKIADAVSRLRAFDVVNKLRALVTLCRDLDRASLSELITVAASIEGMVDDLRKLDTIVAELDGLAQTIGADLRAALGEQGGLVDVVRRQWTESTLEKEIQDIVALGNDVLRIAREYKALVTPAALPGLPPTAVAVGSRSWPTDTAPDTFIDLNATARKPGDQLSVRMTLVDGGQDAQQGVATFDIEAYGWRASLEPSVVLARPDRIAGGDEDFGFAPAVSWMGHYAPRPEDDGYFSSTVRFLEPSVGPHAIFLNFDNEDEIEIGLGLTVAVFDDILQFGVGYNLMSDDSDDGQTYYFVGSSLISLLQQLGGTLE